MTHSPEGRPEGMAAPEPATPEKIAVDLMCNILGMQTDPDWVPDRITWEMTADAIRLYAERRGEEETASLRARLMEVERERDEAREELKASEYALMEAVDLVNDAHAKMLVMICVHCGAEPGIAAKNTHWMECANHPAHAALKARGEEERAKALERVERIVKHLDGCADEAEVMRKAKDASGHSGDARFHAGRCAAYRGAATSLRGTLATVPSGDAKGTR